MQQSIPHILRQIRVARGLSQENIAEEVLKVDAGTYGRYEKGDSEIKFAQVAKIAAYYGMTLDELYHYGDTDFKPQDAPKQHNRVRQKVLITIELDGLTDTLEREIKRLKAINSVINQT